MPSFVRSLLPISRAGIALWAWRNRQSIIEWTGFGARAAQQLVAGDRDDTLTEAKLRFALTREPGNRMADVKVTVEDGVAHLSGYVDADVAERAFELAERTSGVRRVRNNLEVRKNRRRLGART